jgi:hypothetical protein
LPLVGSTSVVTPGEINPLSSASSIILQKKIEMLLRSLW